MRQPYTFIVTLLLDDQAPDLFRGRVRYVATDAEMTFTGVEELVACLCAMYAKEQALAPSSPVDCPPRRQAEE